jgi:hypothetical protein
LNLGNVWGLQIGREIREENRNLTRGERNLAKLNRTLLAATILVVLSISSFSIVGTFNASATVGGWSNQDLPNGNMRQAPLNVKIVFVGIKQQYINISDGFFQWNLSPYHIQRETYYGTDWGVNYTFNYSYRFNQTFDNLFWGYLATIAKIDIARANPYTGLVNNRFYNANAVEDYLYGHPEGYGGIPTNGYVLFLMNITRLADSDGFVNQPHYYNVTYSDVDSTAKVTDGWYGRWMTSWGGHHRLYFIDASAGASPGKLLGGLATKWWNRYHPPIWSLNMNLATKNGINFLNQYLASFVFGAVYGLFSSDFLYPPRIAPNSNYNVTILIFDNCTSYQSAPIINPYPPPPTLPPYDGDLAVTQSVILTAFQALVPFGTWSVKVSYIHLNGTGDPAPYSTLWSVIRSAERTQDAFGNPVKYVDKDQLYHYLQAHLSDFITPQTGQLLIPVFAFAFKDSYNLGYQYEGYEYDNYWGFGYPDVVLVSHSLTDLLGLGGIPYGFTQTIIHETGHALGLAHPFWWDWDEDFVASVMAYYPYEYQFSQFDKDTIQRGYADYYLIRAESMMNSATELKESKTMNSTLLSLCNDASGNLTSALSYYSMMDYTNAMSKGKTSLDLFTLFVAGAEQQSQLTTPTPSSPIITIIAAAGCLVIGIAIGLYIKRKAK